MIAPQRLEIEGRRYVVLPEEEYERLRGQASQGIADESLLPPLPKRNRKGQFPAREYARASMARNLIRDRAAAGLSQRKLAELAGVRKETINRLESGRYGAAASSVKKIDKALAKALRRK